MGYYDSNLLQKLLRLAITNVAMNPEKVLIITGGLISPSKPSIVGALRTQLRQSKFARAQWLELKIKAIIAESVFASLFERRLGRVLGRIDPVVRRYFTQDSPSDPPELTEVVLATLLAQANISYTFATTDEVLADSKRVMELLNSVGCVFLSSTLVRDLSELKTVLRLLKRAHIHIVVGGALAGILCNQDIELSDVDLLAVGYGEMLVPAIADWICSGYTKLQPPPEGRLIEGRPAILHSGTPPTKNLDFLVTPDWAQSARDHNTSYKLIYYESVRGCPYRCSFCNYPFLFDDKRFRFKSAKKMADDWERYVNELGIEYISALDSLFTVPADRLTEFCAELIKRQVKVKWICYARAGDLCNEETVALMKEAGATQLHIGIESGSQKLLDNMNKKTTVEENARALLICRRYEITTIATLIVGYPGETEHSLEQTYRLLEGSPPDFYFLATFSTRVAGVPVLSPESRARFGLRVIESLETVSPYWVHDTMSCADVGNHVRNLGYRLMRNRVSLDAAVFYRGINSYTPQLRSDLLDFQYQVATKQRLNRLVFDAVHGLIDWGLARDVTRLLPAAAPADFAHDQAGQPAEN